MVLRRSRAPLRRTALRFPEGRSHASSGDLSSGDQSSGDQSSGDRLGGDLPIADSDAPFDKSPKYRKALFSKHETGQKFGTALRPSLGLLLDELITFRDLIVDQLDFEC
jgi:hypothetical protein